MSPASRQLVGVGEGGGSARMEGGEGMAMALPSQRPMGSLSQLPMVHPMACPYGEAEEGELGQHQCGRMKHA
jgi:hypothetical protein